MDSYINFTVLPDLELTAPMLLNNLFAKLHRQIGKYGEKQVGVSFPLATERTLGKVLRLHGSQNRMKNIMSENWLRGLSDYVSETSIQPVPSTVTGYRTIKRIQKKSAANKRKRSIAKGWLDKNTAIERIKAAPSDMLKLPYIQLRSLSTQNTMRLYITHGKLQSTPTTGYFNSYGLSSRATVPWF